MRREDRCHEAGKEDQRDKFQQDRDRVLYSSAFRRLSGITQIVRAGEADVFHTRQQHTLKVAQVGRRLAELLIAGQREECEALKVNAEVVEAAALIHDLGHPPFGHMGEHTLNKLVENAGDNDGFEGNAQSFRIVTKLAVHFEQCPGIDLCRATLAACLKYPWLREPANPNRSRKWGAYGIDSEDFHFATMGQGNGIPSTEAEIMDWADDISYSVHDLEDFHRCGAIPWRQVLGDHTERLIDSAAKAWFNRPPDAGGRLRRAMKRLTDFFEPRLFKAIIDEPYEGTRDQRRQLRTMSSQLIGRYITATKLRCRTDKEDDGPTLIIAPNELDEVKILKQITRDYIINNPTLVAQQKGHERIIKTLFYLIFRGTAERPAAFLPRRLEYLWDGDVSKARFAADCIASLTEAEAVGLWARLQGRDSGSVLDPIVR
jgi:dGTPase